MIWPFLLLGVVMLLVLAVLFWGLGTMARGGTYNLRWSNSIMRWRIILQALSIAIFVIILLVGIS